MAQVHIFQQAGGLPWRVVAQNRNAGTRCWDVASPDEAIAKAQYALAEEIREGSSADAAIFVRLTDLHATLRRLEESHAALEARLASFEAATKLSFSSIGIPCRAKA